MRDMANIITLIEDFKPNAIFSRVIVPQISICTFFILKIKNRLPQVSKLHLRQPVGLCLQADLLCGCTSKVIQKILKDSTIKKYIQDQEKARAFRRGLLWFSDEFFDRLVEFNTLGLGNIMSPWQKAEPGVRQGLRDQSGMLFLN